MATRPDRWIKKWSVTGTDTTYIVSLTRDGNWACSCPVWKYRREECKHIKRVKPLNDEGKLLPFGIELIHDERAELDALSGKPRRAVKKLSTISAEAESIEDTALKTGLEKIKQNALWRI